MSTPSSKVDRLKSALRWLEGHRKRLTIQQRSLQRQLDEVSADLDRVANEIEIAAQRLKDLGNS